MPRKALIIVDVQNDFCPGGALTVPHGDEVVDLCDAMIGYAREEGWLIVASRDWHPPNTTHFKDFGGQWPIHCVQDTHGAEFHPRLDIRDITIISKAMGTTDDGYSAFEGYTEDGIGLFSLFAREEITTVYVCGLATEYCVKATAHDASSQFDTYLLIDACRAINPYSEEEENVITELRGDGVHILSVADMLSF